MKQYESVFAEEFGAAQGESSARTGAKVVTEPLNDLSIDLAWLLMVAEQKTPGDPQVTDWGALVAAVSRHDAEIFGVPVYDSPYARAAALLQLLLHVPALERSNALFASAVAYGYLVASGVKVVTSANRWRPRPAGQGR